jgi:hypothetical protein
MHIVVTRLPLTRPLTPEEVARIEREIPPLAADAPGGPTGFENG